MHYLCCLYDTMMPLRNLVFVQNNHECSASLRCTRIMQINSSGLFSSIHVGQELSSNRLGTGTAVLVSMQPAQLDLETSSAMRQLRTPTQPITHHQAQYKAEKGSPESNQRTGSSANVKPRTLNVPINVDSTPFACVVLTRVSAAQTQKT